MKKIVLFLLTLPPTLRARRPSSLAKDLVHLSLCLGQHSTDLPESGSMIALAQWITGSGIVPGGLTFRFDMLPPENIERSCVKLDSNVARQVLAMVEKD